MVKLLWKKSGSSSKSYMELPFDLAVTFLGIYPREMKIHIHIKIFM